MHFFVSDRDSLEVAGAGQTPARISAVLPQAVLSEPIHINWRATDCGVEYTGNRAVKEWVSFLEGLKVLSRKGIIHLDLHRNWICWSQQPQMLKLPRWYDKDFRPFLVGVVD